MPRNTPTFLAWLGLLAHVFVALLAVTQWRRAASGGASALPSYVVWLNCGFAVLIVAYWVQVWYVTITQHLIWYKNDQALPLVAALVAIACVLTLTGKFTGRAATVLQWSVFGIDTTIFIVATLYFMLFEMKRLI